MTNPIGLHIQAQSVADRNGLLAHIIQAQYRRLRFADTPPISWSVEI
jgi:hypothetical protein